MQGGLARYLGLERNDGRHSGGGPNCQKQKKEGRSGEKIDSAVTSISPDLDPSKTYGQDFLGELPSLDEKQRRRDS